MVSCYGFYDVCFNNPKPCCMNPKPCVLTRPFRIAFLFLLFTQLHTLNASAQMRQVYVDNDPNNEVRKISFYSPSEGFVATSKWIGYTADSGKTFTKKYITFSNVEYGLEQVNFTFGFTISGVKAFDQNNLLVYGDYGFVPAILRSTNGGSSFTLVFHSLGQPLELEGTIEDMIFPQGNSIGYAVDKDRLLRTNNGGQSWSQLFNIPDLRLNHLEAVDNNTVLAFTNDHSIAQQRLYKGTNGGTSWEILSLPAGYINYAYFTSATKGFLSMSSGFYTTNNGGVSWILQNDPGITPFETDKMKFVDETTGYALSALNTIFKTTDGGKIWEPLPRDNDYIYLGFGHNDLQYISASQLWAGGGHGFLELSTNGGGTPYPKAFYKVDTTDLGNTVNVNLVNYSKTGYTYQWFKNGVLFGNTYDASYVRSLGPSVTDTIQLVVSNGLHTDTLTRYQQFHLPVRVVSFTPVNAASGTIVTITGQNFINVQSVSFGGVAATSFTVVNSNTIKATVGAGASGEITVTSTTRGTASLSGFTFIPAPVITSFTPTSATAGTTVTITGTDFTGATAVSFGNKPAPFTVVSSTTIMATVPSGGTGEIKIITPGGTATRAGFIALPTFTAFRPVSGGVGTLLTISGTSLSAVTGVFIGGVPAQSFTIKSDTSIVAIVGADGTGSVEITAPTGNLSLPGFTFVTGPSITGFSPASGEVGTNVTIIGTNFDVIPANNIVYFGAVRAAVTGGTATTLTVTVPSGASFEPISVTRNQLTAYASRPFVVTFSGNADLTPASLAGKTEMMLDGYVIHDVATSDLDGDGKSDMAAITTEGLFVYRNTSTATSISFSDKLSIPLWVNGAKMAISDLDGDGNTDIAIVRGGSTLVLFRNTSSVGNISFAPGFEFPYSEQALDIVIGDIDKDGKPDIVRGGSYVTVFRNVSNPGEFSFVAAGDFPVAANSIVLTDLDMDGKIDMSACRYSADHIFIYRNTSLPGAISFAASTNIPVAYPNAIAAGDVDGDGKPDIAAVDAVNNKTVVFKNNSTTGAINFGSGIDWKLSIGYKRPSLGDIDGDGKIDIVVPQNDFYLSIGRNTSSSGMISFDGPINYGQANLDGEFQTIVQDLNGDGRSDVIVTPCSGNSFSQQHNKLFIFFNNVIPVPYIRAFTPVQGIAGTEVTLKGRYFSGTMAVSFGGVPASAFTVVNDTTITAIVAGGATGKVAVTNGYGTTDLPGFVFGSAPVITGIAPLSGPAGSSVTISGSGFNTVPANNIVYFGGTQATVTAATANTLTVTAPQGTTAQPVTVTNNGLTGYATQPFTITFPGAGTAFAGASIDSVYINTNAKGRGLICDIDGDGKLDVVVADAYNYAQRFAVARNTGGYMLHFEPYVNINASKPTLGIATGDLDGDGKKDVVVQKPDDIGLFRNTSTPGSISFTEQAIYTTPVTNTLATASAGIVDLDGDGRPELILPHTSSQSICVYRNLSSVGSIVFDTNMVISNIAGFTDMIMQDVDGDGKADMVVSLGSNGIDVYRNTSTNNTISFATPVRLNYTAQLIRAGDLDGDGRADLVLTNYPYAIARNTSTPGFISFAAKQELSASGSFADIGDMDGDGKADLILNSSGLTLMKNISTPGNITFSDPFSYSNFNVSTATTIVAGDVSSDGKPDLVCFSTHFMTQGTQMYVWTNTIAANMSDVVTCGSSTITLTAPAHPFNQYQWQENKGYGWENIYPNRPDFTGCWNDTMIINNITNSWNGYSYRCIVGADKSGVFNLRTSGTGGLPGVTITTTSPAVCAGTPVTFRATATNGGSNPAYQWQINGVNVGANIDTFNTNALANGAQVKVIMTTGGSTCAPTGPVTSNVITMTVNEPATPTVTITASATTVCAGTPVTFTATPVNGGSTPAYQWKKNGVNAGANSATYTGTFANGDKVYVILTSNATCISTATDNSDTITVTVNPPVTPDIVISGNTIVDKGEATHLNASVSHPGNAPTYQWQDSTASHGWQNIAGQMSEMIDYTPDSTGDKIRLLMTSNAACASVTTVVSNVLTFTVNTTGGRIVMNPVTSTLLIDGLKPGDNWDVLEIMSVSNGNKVLTVNIAHRSSVSIPVSQLAKGMYVVVLKSRTGNTRHWQILKM
jgi:large repetitive protein